MMPGLVSARIISRRLAIIDNLLRQIRALPLDSREAFLSDPRNYASAESCLRRSLEALLDIGRHILAKGYGSAVSEYKAVSTALRNHDVLREEEAGILHTLAGYRNRMVHFYDELSESELYDTCVRELGDIERVCDAYRRWLKAHPEKLERA
jgi:uncharacterized protein YutE (UPF0331/DUF86 family)